MAWYASTIQAYGVLAEDSDFFILPVARYLSVKTLDCTGPYPVVNRTHRHAVLGLLGFSGIDAFLPLAASLLGNDYLPQARLTTLHERMAQRRSPPNTVLIPLVMSVVSQSVHQVLRRHRVPPPMSRSLLRAVLADVLERFSMPPETLENLCAAVLDSCEQYDIIGSVSAHRYPPMRLALHSRLATLGSGTYVPTALFLALLEGRIFRSSVQVLTLGIDRVGRILDLSLATTAPATAEIVRPIRRAIFGVVLATLAQIGSQRQGDVSEDELIMALLSPAPAAWTALHEAPAVYLPPDMDLYHRLQQRFSLAVNTDDGRADYIEDYVHTDTPIAVHATYIVDSLHGRVNYATAQALTQSEAWMAMLTLIDLAHTPALFGLGTSCGRPFAELALAVCTIALLRRGGHITDVGLDLLLAHVLLVRHAALVGRLSRMNESDLPPLSTTAVDMSAIFQCTSDALLELNALLGRPLGNIEAPWRLFDGRVLHFIHAYATYNTHVEDSITRLLALFDRPHLQLARLYSELRGVCREASVPAAPCVRASMVHDMPPGDELHRLMVGMAAQLNALLETPDVPTPAFELRKHFVAHKVAITAAIMRYLAEQAATASSKIAPEASKATAIVAAASTQSGDVPEPNTEADQDALPPTEAVSEAVLEEPAIDGTAPAPTDGQPATVEPSETAPSVHASQQGAVPPSAVVVATDVHAEPDTQVPSIEAVNATPSIAMEADTTVVTGRSREEAVLANEAPAVDDAAAGEHVAPADSIRLVLVDEDGTRRATRQPGGGDQSSRHAE